MWIFFYALSVILSGNALVRYREEVDWMSTFLAQRCILRDGAKTTAADLFAAFGLWWSGDDDDQPSQKEFGSRLTASGLQSIKKSGKRWWAGITLKPKDH